MRVQIEDDVGARRAVSEQLRFWFPTDQTWTQGSGDDGRVPACTARLRQRHPGVRMAWL